LLEDRRQLGVFGVVEVGDEEGGAGVGLEVAELIKTFSRIGTARVADRLGVLVVPGHHGAGQ
jgi:hypothetical protein